MRERERWVPSFPLCEKRRGKKNKNKTLNQSIFLYLRERTNEGLQRPLRPWRTISSTLFSLSLGAYVQRQHTRNFYIPSSSSSSSSFALSWCWWYTSSRKEDKEEEEDIFFIILVLSKRCRWGCVKGIWKEEGEDDDDDDARWW